MKIGRQNALFVHAQINLKGIDAESYGAINVMEKFAFILPLNLQTVKAIIRLTPFA